MDISRLRMYSLGIAIFDKERDSSEIIVLPIEELPYSDGMVKDIKKDFKASTVDHKNISRSSKVTGTHQLTAKWLPYGHSNRASAPDIIKNETVLLFKYSDTEEYFWTTIFHEPELRRLETVLYTFGNIPKGIKKFEKDTSYWVEVSTHDKYIHIHTSKNDGEPYEYDITLDTEKGTFELKDDIGNFLYLNSGEHRWKTMNATGSFMDMHKGVLDIFTPDSINLKTTDYTLNCKSITVNASANVDTTIGGNNTSIVTGNDTTTVTGPITTTGSADITTTSAGNMTSIAAGNMIATATGTSTIGGAGITVNAGGPCAINAAALTLSSVSMVTAVSGPSTMSAGSMSMAAGGSLAIESSGSFEVTSQSQKSTVSGAYEVQADSSKVTTTGVYEIDAASLKVKSAGTTEIESGSLDIKVSGDYKLDSATGNITYSGDYNFSSGDYNSNIGNYTLNAINITNMATGTSFIMSNGYTLQSNTDVTMYSIKTTLQSTASIDITSPATVVI